MNHYSNLQINTNIKIFGFTINPPKNEEQLKNILYGLTNSYEKKHICDFSENSDVVHVNPFIEQKIHFDQISVKKIDFKQTCTLVGFLPLNNGYVVIRIKLNTYPCEVGVHIFLNEKVEDIDLVIDHLSAPALLNSKNANADGMELFDIDYSITYESEKNNKINKHDKNIYPERTDWRGENKNYLHNIECFFCREDAGFVSIHGHPARSVLVCEIHKNYVEDKKSKQFTVNYKNNEKYLTTKFVINDEIYSKNIKKENKDV
jgi:hypothetical protein